MIDMVCGEKGDQVIHCFCMGCHVGGLNDKLIGDGVQTIGGGGGQVNKGLELVLHCGWFSHRGFLLGRHSNVMKAPMIVTRRVGKAPRRYRGKEQ